MSDPLIRNSLLSRASVSSGPSPLQSQVDDLVGGFVEQTTDWRSLAAMTAGGMAYRAGRIGVMGLGSSSALRVGSVGLGLTAEVSTFELTHRGLHSPNPNLWRWNGSGGIRQGLFQSFITFGALKGAGHIAQGQNFIAQHLFQDTAMVLGHQVTGALGLAPRPEGSLAEQFLHAEATNLQLGAGMALAHGFAPGILGVERGLDLSLQGTREGFPNPLFVSGEGRGGLALAVAGGAKSFENNRPRPEMNGPRILLSENWKEKDLSGPEDEISRVRFRDEILSPRPAFSDPVEALRRADFPAEFEAGRVYRISVEEDNVLTAVSRGVVEMWNGPNQTLDFFLNGQRIGHCTFQINVGEGYLSGLDVRVEPAYRRRGLSKSISLYLLKLAHDQGLHYIMDMVINRDLLASLTRSFYKGEFKFAPGALVQVRGPDLNPYTPEMVDHGPPVPLESFDASQAVFDNWRAYRVTGRPNPNLFKSLEPPTVTRSIPSEKGAHSFQLILPDFFKFLTGKTMGPFPVARRGEFPLMLSRQPAQSNHSMGNFLSHQAVEIRVSLSEGAGRGSARLFIDHGDLYLYSIFTEATEQGPGLDPGGATLVMEWLATQAALNRMGFHVLQIENPQVVKILRRQNLLLPDAEVQVCQWDDWVYNFFFLRKLLRWDEPEALDAYLSQWQREKQGHYFLNIGGRPHPRLTADVPPRL